MKLAVSLRVCLRVEGNELVSFDMFARACARSTECHDLHGKLQPRRSEAFRSSLMSSKQRQVLGWRTSDPAVDGCMSEVWTSATPTYLPTYIYLLHIQYNTAQYHTT